MSDRKHILFASGIYILLWLIGSYFLIHGINPDSVSYISISKKYFDGNFNEALNAYWGPLFSWLLIPAFVLRIEPHIFARILFVIFSISLFFIADKYFEKLNVKKELRLYGVLFLILPAIFFSFYRLTPDYILLILVLIYVLNSLDEDSFKSKRQVFFSAFLGALMFLTKSYGLMFFIAFQTFRFIIEFVNLKKFSRPIVLNYFLSIALFVILISPWIYLISDKYGNFTISTSGTINLRIVNPELNFHHPSIESGFVPPSDKYGISAWDDPDINSYPDWSPFSSFADFKHFTSNTLKNIIKLFLFILSFTPVIFVLLLINSRKIISNRKYIIIFTAALVYGIGYTPIYVENRYVWPSFILISLLGTSLISLYFEKIFYGKVKSLIIVSIIILSFIPFFYYGISQQIPAAKVYIQAKEIKNKFGISGNIASTNYWDHTLVLSYFLESKFFGTEKLSLNSQEMIKKAQNFGVNYIFDYSKNPGPINKLIFVGKLDSISIYRVA